MADRLWKGSKFALIAMAIGATLALAMAFIHVDWAVRTLCFAPVFLGFVGFAIGFLRGGKTPKQLRARTLQAIQKECANSTHGLAVVESKTVPVGAAVTTGEQFATALKAHVYLFGAKVRIDCIQWIRLSHADGEFSLVIPWSGRDMLPHEFCSILPGRLPSAVCLTRDVFGSWGSGDWVGLHGAKDHPMAHAAQESAAALAKEIEWNWEKGRLKIELKWGLQAIPLSSNRFLHLMQTAQLGIFRKRFGLDWYWERQRAFCEFVSTLTLEGQQERHVFFPASSLTLLGDLLDDDLQEVTPA